MSSPVRPLSHDHTSPTGRPDPSRRGRRLGAAAISSCLLGLLATGGFAEAQGDTSSSTSSSTSSTTVTSVEGTPADPTTPTTPTDPTAPTDTTSSVAPAATPSSFSLPLFGVPLTVDITTGPGGAIAGVALNPADGMTATTNRPNKVAFVNDDGTAKVVVRSNGGGQRVEARAGSLDAFLDQPGGWSGEIFPGVPASVAFTVTSDGGAPGITVGDVTGPVVQIGEVERSTDVDDDGEQEREATVRIHFAQDGMRRTLSVKVEVETDDGETKAKLRISLSRLKTEPFAPAAVGVEQTWTALLCDGTTASVAYTIGDGGTIALGAVSPEPSRTKAEGNSVEVRFGTGERVRLTVRAGDGGPAVKVHHEVKCRNAPDPTLNVPVQDADDHDRDGDDDQHGDRDDRERGDRGDRGSGRARDGGSSSTGTTAPTTVTAPATEPTTSTQPAGGDRDGRGDRHGRDGSGDDRDGSDDDHDGDDGDGDD